MSDLLLLLFTKEQPWAICSWRSLQKSNGSDLHFFRSQKMSDLLEKPKSLFPTLLPLYCTYLGSGFSHLNKCFYFVQLLSGIIFLVVYQLAHYSIVKLSVNKDSKKLFKLFAEKYSNSRRFIANHSKLQKNSKLILHYIHRL